jgi:DNA repair exonuclease SbcCD ATPase subunit
LTEREWQRLENTMRFVVEQQAKFETNFARADRRFAQVESRLDRLDRLADRVIRAGERRMAKAEAEIGDLRATLKSFLQALRRSAGNGRSRP